MTEPNRGQLTNRAYRVLDELPLIHAQLATSSHRDRAARSSLLATVRQVHRSIAESFGENRPPTIGVISACSDLHDWLFVWVWHPWAAAWIEQLEAHTPATDSPFGEAA